MQPHLLQRMRLRPYHRQLKRSPAQALRQGAILYEANDSDVMNANLHGTLTQRAISQNSQHSQIALSLQR